MPRSASLSFVGFCGVSGFCWDFPGWQSPVKILSCKGRLLMLSHASLKWTGCPETALARATARTGFVRRSGSLVLSGFAVFWGLPGLPCVVRL